MFFALWESTIAQHAFPMTTIKRSYQMICKKSPFCPHTKKNAVKQKKVPAPAAASIRRSAGDVGADSPSARTAWRKTSGECPVMVLPGSVRIAETKTAMETSSENPMHLS
jgi:hypothetical protein